MQARRGSCRFSMGQIQQGFGTLVMDKTDCPRADRQRMADRVEDANRLGAIPGDLGTVAQRITAALQSPDDLQPALRQHLQTDGRETERQVARVANVVPELKSLLNWL